MFKLLGETVVGMIPDYMTPVRKQLQKKRGNFMTVRRKPPKQPKYLISDPMPVIFIQYAKMRDCLISPVYPISRPRSFSIGHRRS